MSKILVSFASSILDEGEFKIAAFYEGFLQALVRGGHEAKAINTSNFLAKPWNGSNDLAFGYSEDRLKNDIRDFNPDLIIAFNHSVPQIALDTTTCPVAIWNADASQFFNNQDYIKRNLERYTFLTFIPSGYDDAKRFGFKEDRIFEVLAGTDINPISLEQDKNISFIGTNFIAPYSFIQLLRDPRSSNLRPVIEELSDNFYGDHESILKKHDAEWMVEYLDSKSLATLSSPQNRISLLNDLQDLGLAIYGDSDWHSIGLYLPWLSMSHRKQKVYTLSHLQDIYNSSKLCINIPHAQNTNGFPWRVMDIMASNGCLVTNKSSGLKEFVHDYVDLPMYEDRRDAYELCQKLLKDEVWRREIVEASQCCIHDKGRWDERIRRLDSIFNLKPSSLLEGGNEGLPILRQLEIKSETYQYPWYRLILQLLGGILQYIPIGILKLSYKIAVSLGFDVPYRLIALSKKNA